MNTCLITKAEQMLTNFKGSTYSFGLEVLDQVGYHGAKYGKNVLLVANQTHLNNVVKQVIYALEKHGMVLVTDPIPGAKPNTPTTDVERLAKTMATHQFDLVVVIGGGSSIDAVKAALALNTLSLPLDALYGTGLVSKALDLSGKSLKPLIAVATVAGSAAHLTKYANVTNFAQGQKKLIVDEALVPASAVFDYNVTTTLDPAITIDGIMDGISHLTEVFYGIDDNNYMLVAEMIKVGLPLLLGLAPQVLADPNAKHAREGIGLATDLGGYAIMTGGTNGAHLTSFSLVDILSHGRACGLLNPYYTVLFGSAIQPQLRILGKIYQEYGFIEQNIANLSGRELALVVAEGMQSFLKSISAPTQLKQIPQFSEAHLKRALLAAKDRQLAMKLENMPLPITADMVDEAIGSVLTAAREGDLSFVKSL